MKTWFILKAFTSSENLQMNTLSLSWGLRKGRNGADACSGVWSLCPDVFNFHRLKASSVSPIKKVVWTFLYLPQQAVLMMLVLQPCLMRILINVEQQGQQKGMWKTHMQIPQDGQIYNLGRICIFHNENRSCTRALPVWGKKPAPCISSSVKIWRHSIKCIQNRTYSIMQNYQI